MCVVQQLEERDSDVASLSTTAMPEAAQTSQMMAAMGAKA